MIESPKRILATFALAAFALTATAVRAEPAIWTVEGRGNKAWLFGSVHVLPKGGFATEAALGDAWKDAEVVCLEVDTSALDRKTITRVTLEMAMDPDGRTLLELMGDKAERARTLAEAAGVELAIFAPYEPWFAGLTIAMLALQLHGYDVEHGVERMIEQSAEKDQKTRCGLETFEEQLGFLDGLELDVQQEILLQSLAEAEDADKTMRQLLEAWQAGDTERLLQVLEEDFEEYPGVADRLVYERNERWAEALSVRLDGGDDVLVVVGALHMVGERGLPALLEKRGFKVRRH